MDGGKVKLLQQLGYATSTRHLSCALFPGGGQVALGVEGPTGLATVVKASYNPFG